MRVYEVCYQIQSKEFLGRPDQIGWVKVGRFSDRRLAEQTLANLAHNPAFRGGHINSDEQDDDS